MKSGRRRASSFNLHLIIIIIIIIIIVIIIHNLYSAALLKDPAALYNNDNVNIKSVR